MAEIGVHRAAVGIRNERSVLDHNVVEAGAVQGPGKVEIDVRTGPVPKVVAPPVLPPAVNRVAAAHEPTQMDHRACISRSLATRALVPEAIEIEFHRGGVERRPVVELYAFAQMKGVGRPSSEISQDLARPGTSAGVTSPALVRSSFSETFEDLIGAPAACGVSGRACRSQRASPRSDAGGMSAADPQSSRHQRCCRERNRQSKSTKNHEPSKFLRRHIVGTFTRMKTRSATYGAARSSRREINKLWADRQD